MTCICGCPPEVHIHYRPGLDCGRCGADVCPRYRSDMEEGPRRRPGRALHLTRHEITEGTSMRRTLPDQPTPIDQRPEPLSAVTCLSCGAPYGQPHYPWCQFDLGVSREQ